MYDMPALERIKLAAVSLLISAVLTTLIVVIFRMGTV